MAGVYSGGGLGMKRVSLVGLMTLAVLYGGVTPLWAQNHAAPSRSAGVRLDVAPGSSASYRVREQLARLNFPNDAVGTTQTVTGSLHFAADGAIEADQSKLRIDLRTLKSDEERRDAYLRDRTLRTDRFPMAEFAARRTQGLMFPLPSSGAVSFQLIGDLAVHGVTSEVAWNVTGNLGSDLVTGRATTRFPFSKFKLTIPRLLGLVSVNDDIQLEVDLRMRRTVVQ
jgi:polyisoprenoid-binding protein YceI